MNSLAVTLGQNVIINIIPDVYSLLKSTNKTFTDLLEELDIEFDIRVVELLLEDIKRGNEMIVYCKMKILETILKIKEEIEKIHLKIIDIQYTSPLTRWSHSYQENVDRLKKYKIILNSRRDTLMNVLTHFREMKV